MSSACSGPGGLGRGWGRCPVALLDGGRACSKLQLPGPASSEQREGSRELLTPCPGMVEGTGNVLPGGEQPHLVTWACFAGRDGVLVTSGKLCWRSCWARWLHGLLAPAELGRPLCEVWLGGTKLSKHRRPPGQPSLGDTFLMNWVGLGRNAAFSFQWR